MRRSALSNCLVDPVSVCEGGSGHDRTVIRGGSVGIRSPRVRFRRSSSHSHFVDPQRTEQHTAPIIVASGFLARRLIVGELAKEPVVPIARIGTRDEELVAGLIRAEPAAIAELFDRFRAVVRKMLIRTLGSAYDVDDLAQETFLVVLRRVETLREPALLSSFVIGAAVRVARNELRKRALRRFIGLEDVPLAVDMVDPELRDGVARLYRALERLDASARVVFVLRHVEELELTELALAMKLSVSTVKRRLALAERRFDAIARNDPVLRSYLEGRR